MAYAQAPGARLYYEVTGSGTPIVFVHETCADMRSWEAQVRWFSRAYRCITYNARGYPGSEPGIDPSMQDHRRLSDDIGAVMDAAGVDKAFVVGHSMGAYVTAHFMVNHPDRALGVVLEGLGAGSDDQEAFRAATLAMAAALRTRGLGPMVDQMARGPNRVQHLQKDPRGFAEFLQHLREIDPAGLANVLQHCHSKRPAIYTLEAQLRQSNVPALIAVGDEDTPCIAPANFLKRTIPAAGLWICPRTGHSVSLEEPVLFNATVQSFVHAVEQGNWKARDPSSYQKNVLDAPPKS
jgi:3-oxoadipate enol-lactonase